MSFRPALPSTPAAFSDRDRWRFAEVWPHIGPGRDYGLRLGALDFISRDSAPAQMERQLAQALARRERWLEERRRQRALEAILASHDEALRGTYGQVLEALGAALDTRDP